MWERKAVLEWVRRAEDMSDDLREAPGSYEARFVVPAATGNRPAARAAR